MRTFCGYWENENKCGEPSVEILRCMSNGYKWITVSPGDPEPDYLLPVCARHFDLIWSAHLEFLATH